MLDRSREVEATQIWAVAQAEHESEEGKKGVW
jgi:hypothetical protein